MTVLPAPATIAELAALVRATPCLLPVGARTKPALSAVDVPLLPLTGLRGITAYEPTDFTLTALAGTPLAEIDAEIAVHGQCLPFDPPFVTAGSTLGGAVATGLNGPGRFGRGGVRDCVLGLSFVDGRGEVLTVGSRVVKNVAGFDLPKFFVGSLGRHGVLAEITIKLCPRATETATLEFAVDSTTALVAVLHRLAVSTTEPEAVDARPLEGRVFARFAGAGRRDELLAGLGGKPGDPGIWDETTTFGWAHPEGSWLKVPAGLHRLPALLEQVRTAPEARLHLTAAGDAAWLSLPPNDAATGAAVREAGFDVLPLRGSYPLPLQLGSPSPTIQRVVAVLDPANRFPALRAV